LENTQENLVKKTCKELGITQKELAEITKVSLPTIQRWSFSNNIPPQHIVFLNLILENRNLYSQIEKMQNVFQDIQKYSSNQVIQRG